MKNNKGYTLLELIIVVAIIGVMTGALVMSTGFLGKSRVNSAMNQIQSSYSKARTNKMTKQRTGDTPDLTISYDRTEGTYYCQVRGENKTKILTDPYTIYFWVYNDASADAIGTKHEIDYFNDEVTFTFTRSGALKPYDESSESYISRIDVETKTMYIIFETGKYSLTEPDFGS